MAFSSKRPKYSCKYSKAWESKFSFVKPSKCGSTHALCTICKCDMKITHGGANDLTQHAKSKGHMETERMLLSSKAISDFFPSKSDIQTKVSGLGMTGVSECEWPPILSMIIKPKPTNSTPALAWLGSWMGASQIACASTETATQPQSLA